MHFINNIESLLSSLRRCLGYLSDEEYARPLPLYNGSSLGGHVRHIVEFYQCLIEQYPHGTVNYALRKRDHQIETSIDAALNAMRNIPHSLRAANGQQHLWLETEYGELPARVHTTFERELVNNIEHTIHHMALITIGFRAYFPQVVIPDTFGMAPSTLAHLKKVAECAR